MTRRQVWLVVLVVVGYVVLSLWVQSGKMQVREPGDRGKPDFTEAAQWAVASIDAPENQRVISAALPDEYESLVESGRVYRFSDASGNQFAYFPSVAQLGYFYSESDIPPPQPPSTGELIEIHGKWWEGELAEEHL